MKNIIKELYYGNIQPYEKPFNRSTEYDKFITQIVSNEESLRNFFNEHDELSDFALSFENMIKAQLILSDLTECKRFTEGFQLGARFAIEILLSNEDIDFKDI